jgi:hypothetical protein
MKYIFIFLTFIPFNLLAADSDGGQGEQTTDSTCYSAWAQYNAKLDADSDGGQGEADSDGGQGESMQIEADYLLAQCSNNLS